MVVAVACEQAPQPTAATASASASASAAAVPAPSASTPPVRPRVAPATQPGCRVLSLKGEVKGPSGPVPNGGVLYGTEWLELGKGSELSLRHTVSTRELTVKGPGKALPCLDGDEEVLLVEGTIETGSGAGARPGAEVVIYTSFGTVSYGDAQIAIRASKGRIQIASSKGEAWIRPTRGVTRKGPEKLVGGNDKATLTAAVRPEAALQDCERAAGEAESLGRAVFSRPRPTAARWATVPRRTWLRARRLGPHAARRGSESPARPTPRSAKAWKTAWQRPISSGRRSGPRARRQQKARRLDASLTVSAPHR